MSSFLKRISENIPKNTPLHIRKAGRIRKSRSLMSKKNNIVHNLPYVSELEVGSYGKF